MAPKLMAVLSCVAGKKTNIFGDEDKTNLAVGEFVKVRYDHIS